MLVLGGLISQKVESVEFICSKRGTKIKIKEIFFFFERKNQRDRLENFSQNFYIYLNVIKLYKRLS